MKPIINSPGIHNRIFDPYYIYHIEGIKIGITNNLENRVEKSQGFKKGEYEVVATINNIFIASFEEIKEQKKRGYVVETQPYYKLFNNSKLMRTLSTALTTGFYCKTKKELQSLINGSITLKTPNYGNLVFDTPAKIKWLVTNTKKSFKHKTNRGIAPLYVQTKLAYEYLKALPKPKPKKAKSKYPVKASFPAIRKWAYDKKLYGHPSSSIQGQALKLGEEFGETQKAVLKGNTPEIIDGIGDMVVVLTSMAELAGVSIEDCIQTAWTEIRTRKGKPTGKGDFLKE